LPKDARLDHWDGDRKTKDVATMKTLSSNISFSWSPVQADVRTTLKWDWLTEADFDTIQTMYESAGSTYEFGIHDPYEPTGKTYIVDILDFKGIPYQAYYRDITLVLKLRAVA